MISILSQHQEPRPYEEDAKGPGCVKAKNKEISALLINNTWELVDVPTGKKTITRKCVYTVKMKLDGSTERLKARLVIRGFD